jgi:hypothetical protein
MLAERKKKRWTILAVFSAAIAVAACASQDQSAARTQIGGAQSAISQAERANAREYAPVELTTAEQQLTNANKALEDKDYVKAKNLAQQAAVNAELAAAKADTSKTRSMAQSIQRSIEDLRQEINQNANVD